MSRPLAVVTGASSGIGRAFALDLALRGHDLLVVARRRERLEDLAAEVAPALASTRIETWDLAREEGRAAACAALAALPRAPEMLVLNAGFGDRGAFWECDAARADDMVAVNCLGVLSLARAALPGMVAAGRGAVIVVSSAAAYQPVPYTATYAATKAFELSLTRAIAAELRGTGVRALAVCPGPTSTEFGQVAGTSGVAKGVPRDTPEDVVATTWKALRAGRSAAPSGRVARVVRAASAVVPPALSARIAAALHRPRDGRGGP